MKLFKQVEKMMNKKQYGKGSVQVANSISSALSAKSTESISLGRNEPCICGSGKKYKKCCLGLQNEASNSSKFNPTMLDLEWQKIRRTEGTLVDDVLMPYVRQHIKMPFIMDFVFDEFTVDLKMPNETVKAALMDCIFLPWFLFSWVPYSNFDLTKRGRVAPIAIQYLRENQHYLSDYQVNFINTACLAHYSYYRVLAIEPGKSLTLKDMLLDKEVTIKEYNATKTVNLGEIIFTKVIEIDGQSIAFGMMPYVMPAEYGTEIIHVKHYILEQENRTKLSVKLLRDYWDEALREFFFKWLLSRFTPPTLYNTDGDEILFHTLELQLAMLPEETFDLLFHLTLDDEEAKQHYIDDAKKNKQGEIVELHFSWSKKNKKCNAVMDNTIIANIKLKLNDNRKLRSVNNTSDESNSSEDGAVTLMTIETNSSKRAKLATKTMRKLFGDKIISLTTTSKSVEEEVEFQRLQRERSEKDDYENQEKDTHINEFKNTEEMHDILHKMGQEHWKRWLDESIPALGGLTPNEAAKNDKGRELLEELLLSFEARANNLESENIFKPDVDELRRKLGLKKVSKKK